MKRLNLGLAAAAVLAMGWVTGCGGGGGAGGVGGGSTPTSPGVFAGPTLHQFAFVATTGGVDVFAVSGAGAVSAPILDPATTGLNGIASLAVALNQQYLVVVDSNGQLDSFTINPTTGALTAVTMHQAATANGADPVQFGTQANGSNPPFLGGALVLDNTSAFGAAIAFDQTTQQVVVEGFTVNPLTGAITAVGAPASTSSTGPALLTQLAVGFNARNQEAVLVGTNHLASVDSFGVTPGSANLVFGGTTTALPPDASPILAVAMHGSLGLFSDQDGNAAAFTAGPLGDVQVVGSVESFGAAITGATTSYVGGVNVGVLFYQTMNILGVTITPGSGLRAFIGQNPTASVVGQLDGGTLVIPPSGGQYLVLVVSNTTSTTGLLTAFLMDPVGQSIQVPMLTGNQANVQATTSLPAILSNSTVGTVSSVF